MPAALMGQCGSTQNNAATSADHSQLGLQSLMLRKKKKKNNSGRNYNCYSFLTTSISYTRKYQEFSLGYSTKVQKKNNTAGLGEGNGNPLQYSCLENPMDGGA